jgi:tellurite resistance protein TerC
MIVWLYIGFILFVLAALSLDLGVLNRKVHVIKTGEALAWTTLWVTLAMVFAELVYFIYEHDWLGIASASGTMVSGKKAALEFITGYVVEESLSLDNMVVIAIIFSSFRVPSKYQHRVLFWGIVGALVMRGIMIAAGTALLARFEWILYVFGVLLLLTALRLMLTREEKMEPDKNWLVRLARKIYPVASGFHGTKFFIKVDGQRSMTLLFLVLLVVESSDVLFAVDSIPAVIAVTRDPFLVFTSNVFAILGLRSLYFALAGMVHKFKYLKSSLVVLLAFIGVKMLIEHHYPIPVTTSLVVIVGILSFGIVASLIAARRAGTPLRSTGAAEVDAESSLTPDYVWKQARRLAVLVLGSGVILVGTAMLVLPGPGTLVIAAGLALLGTEFFWARRILQRLKREALAMVNSTGGTDGKG